MAEQHQEPPSGFRWRLVFAVLGAFGMAIIYGLKVNLSVAIVAMLNHTALALNAEGGHHGADHVVISDGSNDSSSEQEDLLLCFDPDKKGHGSDSSEDGPFTWTEPEQGLVLGSYFWGYFITQIPGGRIADVAGGKWVFFVAVIMNIIPTLLSPFFSHLGYQYFIIMRVIEGLGGGVTFPAMNVLIAKWAPPSERSTITAIAYGGTSLGTVVSIPTAGLIAGSLGWQFVFYIHGGVAILWCVLWLIFVTDTPATHGFMSQAEKEYIAAVTNTGRVSDQPHVRPPVPWKNIFLSGPVWAIIIAHTLNNFGWYMLLVELPLFMRTGLGFEIKENAALSALPFLCNWLYSIVYSNRLDWAKTKGWISTTVARKLSQAIASVIPAVCLVGVCLVGCEKTAVVVLMVIATLFYGSMFPGVFSNHVDIASNYAGLLMGLSNMAATISGFTVPAFVGFVTHGHPGIGPWHIVFYTTAALLAVEFVCYTLLASGVEQPWNRSKSQRDADDEAAMRLRADNET